MALINTSSLVFDPLASTEGAIKDSLRNKFGPRKKGVYSHPYKNKILIYDATRNVFSTEKFVRPSDPSTLLDSTNRGVVEDNISERIKKFPPLAKLSEYLIHPASEGQQTFKTELEGCEPFVFVVSNQKNNDYFDFVAIPIDFNDGKEPLYYGRKTHEDLPYQHSGDVGISGEKLLLHHLSIRDTFKPRRSSYRSVVTVQGYSEKSLIELQDCEPNVCIVDHSVRRIIVVHCPLSPDYVKRNSIGHLASFEYFPDQNSVVWTVPSNANTMFVDSKFTVGAPIKYYTPGLGAFLECVTSRECVPETFAEEAAEIVEVAVNGRPLVEVDGRPLLIIQEPLMAQEECVIINKILKGSFTGMYTFHQCIKSLSWCGKKIDSHGSQCKFSLPIAGGSIIMNSPLLKLGTPPDTKDALTFSHHLQHSTGAVVIVSDDYSASNIPTVCHKLNALYVVIPHSSSQQQTQNQSVEQFLNSVDISMVLAHQGPLSVVVVYVPFEDSFFYYRGFWRDRVFGEKVSIEEITNHKCPKTPLRVPTFAVNANKYPVYSIEGRELFEVEVDEDPISILNKIKESVPPHPIDFDDLKSVLRPICGQLEVILDPSKFDSMISIVVEKAKLTKRRCLNIILANSQDIDDCPTQAISKELNQLTGDGGGVYSKRWLINTLAKINGVHNLLEDGKTTFKMASQIVNIIEREAESGLPTVLLDILGGCVACRTSYGVRGRDLMKVMKRKRIKYNVAAVENTSSEEVDCFLEDNCKDEGVLIYKLDTNILVNYLNETDVDQAVSKYGGKITSVDPRFRQFSNVMASTLLPDTHQEEGRSHHQVLSFEYNGDQMIILPLLDHVIQVMESCDSVLNFEWSKVTERGPLEYARIILRRTIFELIPLQIRERFNIKDPGHTIVGKLTLFVLMSAMTYLVNILETPPSHSVSGVSGLTKQMRAIVGIMISIMASGGDRVLSHAYQAVLYNNALMASKVNIAEDGWLMTCLIEWWPWLRLDGIPVKNNASNCVQNRLRCLALAILSKPSQYEIQLREKTRSLRRLPDWLYDTVRPMVVAILKTGSCFPNIENEDAKLCNYSRFREENCLEINVADVKMREVEQLEVFFSEFCRQWDQKPPTREPNTTTHYDDEKDSLLVAELLKDIVNLVDKDPQRTKQSGFYKSLDKLKRVWTSPTSTPESKAASWCAVQSSAYDVFVRRSALFRSEVGSLVEYVRSVKIEDYENEDRRAECHKTMRKMRSTVISKILEWKNPYCSYTRFPNQAALKDLSACECPGDYIILCTHRNDDNQQALQLRETAVKTEERGLAYTVRNVREKRKKNERYECSVDEKSSLQRSGILLTYAPGPVGHFMNWFGEESLGERELITMEMQLSEMENARKKRVLENDKIIAMDKWYKKACHRSDSFDVVNIITQAIQL